MVTSEKIKTAQIFFRYNVLFVEKRNGEIVYRDGILANSVKEAIASRFGGTLPAGFEVENVVRLAR